jgi:predicted Fe-Mo cluster-binding NifX family protein
LIKTKNRAIFKETRQSHYMSKRRVSIMKIAVSSQGKNLESSLDPRFGRCAYFLIAETDDMSFEAFNNENMSLGGGAGIQSAQFVASKGVKAILTGYCGPNAARTLSAAGVELYVGQTGTVKETIEKYLKNELNATNEANVADHFGMEGPSPTPDTQSPGFGGGRGMGGGRCRGGMGRGMGRGRFGGGRGR